MEILQYGRPDLQHRNWVEPAIKIVWTLWGIPLLLLSLFAMSHPWLGVPLLAFAAMWWVVCVGLLLNRTWSWRLAWIVLIPWGLAVAQLLIRVAFVVINRGFDTPTRGSPGAFLLGIIVETLLLTIPTSAIVLLLCVRNGWITIRLPKRRRRSRWRT